MSRVRFSSRQTEKSHRISAFASEPKTSLDTLYCRHHHDIPAIMGLQWYKGNGKKSPSHKDGARLLRWPQMLDNLSLTIEGLKRTLLDAIESRDGTGGIVKQSLATTMTNVGPVCLREASTEGHEEKALLMVRLVPCWGDGPRATNTERDSCESRSERWKSVLRFGVWGSAPEGRVIGAQPLSESHQER